MTFSRTWSRISWSAILEAATEISVITILCLLPLVGIAFHSYLHQPIPTPGPGATQHQWQPFMRFLSENVTKGQLAFYAISNWATVSWLCGKEYQRNLFPGRVILAVLSICGFFYCAILIDPAVVAPNAEPSIMISSAAVYLLSMICYFAIALFGKITPSSTEDSNNDDVKTLRQKLHHLRGTNG
jgi:hypothetical protein